MLCTHKHTHIGTKPFTKQIDTDQFDHADITEKKAVRKSNRLRKTSKDFKDPIVDKR